MKKSKFLIIFMLVLLCFPISLLNTSKDVYAALTGISASELPTNRGDAVTGDDIINVGRYLYGTGYSYSELGTCTGFVTRVLVYLKVAKPLVSRNDNWYYIYTEDNWDSAGYSQYPAAWGPSDFKSQVEKMVSAGTAEYIGVIPVSNPSVAQTLGIQNGDLLVTPEGETDGHVAFAIIDDDGRVKSFGNTGGRPGVTILEFSSMVSNKKDDTYVYRLVKPNGNLKIEKKDNHGKNLPNTVFKIVGPNGEVYDRTTDENGVIELTNIPSGEYTVTEVQAPTGLINAADGKETKVTVSAGQTVTYTRTNYYQRGSSIIQKVDAYEGENPKGDASLAGAEYKLYAKIDIYEGTTKIYSAGQVVSTAVTKENGRTDLIDNLPIGEYYWQESEPSKGYNINDETIDFSIEYKGQDATKASETEFESKEDKYYGRARVIKMDNSTDGSTDKSAAEGAILKLTLKSDPTQSYEATIDENGNAEFIDKEFAALHPDELCTIPYGIYELTEVQASNSGVHTYFHINPETVNIDKDQETEIRLVMDEPVSAYLRVIKTDAVSNKTVKIAGAKFKIWDCQNNNWVTQMRTPDGVMISEFETNSEGSFVTPEKLAPGKYIVYETEAPEGYYLNDEWKLPANEEDYGVEGKGGKVIQLDKKMVGLSEDADYDKDLVVIGEVEMPNYPLTGKLEIHKTGEMLADSEVASTEYGEKYTPVYSLEGLPGVTYNIVAAEDIKSKDGTYTYVSEGTVVDTITTDERGIAVSKELYLGEYKIVEVVTPLGYIKDTNIENVVIENTDKTVAVKTHVKELNNVRQKLKITFEKEYKEADYSAVEVKDRFSTFGVYANEDLRNYEGDVVISKDSLIDVITIEGEETNVTSTIDLPAGKYYVQELETSYPYTVNTEKKEVTLEHTNTTQEVVTITSEKVVNDYEKGSVTLVKLSSSSSENLTLNGDEVTSELDTKVNEMLEAIKGMTEAELKQYLEEHEIKFVPGATYKVYTDKECTQALKQKVDGEYKEVELVTTDSGIIKIEDIPLGKYYLKEVKAPAGYEISKTPVEIELTREDKGTMVYRAIIEEATKSQLITKTDIFTGETIPNCTFEIKDEEGNVLLHSVTNEHGEGYIPVDMFEDGKTYTYTEISAPEMYKLNTEPHEFVAKFNENGEWITEKIAVENLRKEATVTLEKLDFADSKAIPNCKFELRSLETDFVVEGVTDENGVYVFENIPYGRYTYTELEAPEEYMIDTEPHEIEINAEEMKIQVTNEKAPETGDIAVIALAAVAVLSVAGIVFVIAKNRKKASK